MSQKNYSIRQIGYKGYLGLQEYQEQSWKKLHAAHTVRADIYFRIEDILVQKSRTYFAVADLCGDFDYFEVNIEE
jgi:hypothetical protein